MFYLHGASSEAAAASLLEYGEFEAAGYAHHDGYDSEGGRSPRGRRAGEALRGATNRSGLLSKVALTAGSSAVNDEFMSV